MKAEIVSKIEELRVMRKMSKKTLAKNAGISATYYSMIARGDSVPSVSIVESLAVELGVRICLVMV